MKLLALDTSSDACSVALRHGDQLYESHGVEARMHTRVLMPAIRRLLDDAGLECADLDAIVLGNGPGSFIGMRIGASVAQGLAFAAGKCIVPVSSLAAIAAQVMAEEDAATVVVTQDARMDEVYAGLYSRSATGLPVAAADESIFPSAALPILQAAQDCIAAGAGWRRYPAMLEANKASISACSATVVPSARYLLDIALPLLGAGEGTGIAPETLQPAYLRHQVASPPA